MYIQWQNSEISVQETYLYIIHIYSMYSHHVRVHVHVYMSYTDITLQWVQRLT